MISNKCLLSFKHELAKWVSTYTKVYQFDRNPRKSPAHSPDMLPNKHVCDMVGWQLVCHTAPPTTVDAFWTHIQTVWREIPQEPIEAIFNSMPQCLEALIAAHSGFTKILNSQGQRSCTAP